MSGSIAAAAMVVVILLLMAAFFTADILARRPPARTPDPRDETAGQPGDAPQRRAAPKPSAEPARPYSDGSVIIGPREGDSPT